MYCICIVYVLYTHIYYVCMYVYIYTVYVYAYVVVYVFISIYMKVLAKKENHPSHPSHGWPFSIKSWDKHGDVGIPYLKKHTYIWVRFDQCMCICLYLGKL